MNRINKRNSTTVNTAANLAAKAWSILSTYIFIPQYIAHLGEEAYGLVSFFATLQSVLQLLGVSLSSTLRREFATGDDSEENLNRKYKILRSVENIYFVIAFIIVIICSTGSGFIANGWLHIENISTDTVEKVIALMGVSIGLQLVGNLWHGCILGSGNQVIANIFVIIWSVMKSVGSLVICITTSNVEYFYMWHIFSDCLYLLIERIYIHKYLGKQTNRWQICDFINLKSVWKYTLGLFAISIIAVINKQLDKTVISGYLSLTELGAYNLATTLGSLTLIIPNAISVAVFASFTREYTTNFHTDLNSHYRVYSLIASTISACMGAFIAVYASDLILFWSKSDNYVSLIRQAAPFVVMGSAVLGWQEVPYSMALAHGETKINNLVGIVSLPVIIVGTFFAVRNFGLMGAGVTYFTLMSIQTLVYVFIITKRYTNYNPALFVLMEIVPLVAAFLVALVSRGIVYQISDSPAIRSGCAVVIGAVTLAVIFVILLYLVPDLKRSIQRKGKRI